MPTIWNFDADDQTNSGDGSQYTRINSGRSEENLNNGREGGLRIENEDGIELWFSIDPATNDGNGYMAWVDDTGAVSGEGVWNSGDTGDGNLYHAAYNGTGNPDADVLDPDVFVIRPSERDSDGNTVGRLVGTEDDPVTLNFKSGLGIWKVTFYAVDGSTIEVEVGNDDRYDESFNNGNNVDWLIQWSGESASAVGTFTHVTVESLTVAIIDVKNPVFVLDDVSMDSYFCFLKNTLIATPEGDRQVQDLKLGDHVQTADGRVVPIKWVGYQTLDTNCALPERLEPVRFMKGSLGAGLPKRDLYVTADHAMFIDGLLINASTLVNGHTVQFVPVREFGDQLVVYHVETEKHEVILAEGTPTESFVDGSSRKDFDNFSEYLEHYGSEEPIEELMIPRVLSPRHLPDRIKSKLKSVSMSMEQVGQSAA